MDEIIVDYYGETPIPPKTCKATKRYQDTQSLSISGQAFEDLIIDEALEGKQYSSPLIDLKVLAINVRIVQDLENRDGWITKAVEDDKIGFISNLSQHIHKLKPGQLYKAEVIQTGPTYQHVRLLHLDLSNKRNT